MAPTRSARYRTTDELLDFVPVLDAAPKDAGTLNLVVRRPAVGAREVLDVGRLDAAYGLEGDTWIERGSKRTKDGSSHPDMQLNVMSHRRSSRSRVTSSIWISISPKRICPRGPI